MNDEIYIDFEMNKFRNGPAEIIAIGAIKVREEQIVDRFYSLVALEISDEVSVDITMLTGITNFDMKDAPSFSEAWVKFTEWAGEDVIYCWGDYDRSCLSFTWKIHQKKNLQLASFNIHNFISRMVDLEAMYGYDKFYYKQSLRNILLSLNSKLQIDVRKLHNPTYDSELLFEFHKQAQISL